MNALLSFIKYQREASYFSLPPKRKAFWKSQEDFHLFQLHSIIVFLPKYMRPLFCLRQTHYLLNRWSRFTSGQHHSFQYTNQSRRINAAQFEIDLIVRQKLFFVGCIEFHNVSSDMNGNLLRFVCNRTYIDTCLGFEILDGSFTNYRNQEK